MPKQGNKHTTEDSNLDELDQQTQTLSIDSGDFYSTYLGHSHALLQQICDFARQKDYNICWLVGDSSLDNKHWLDEQVPAVSLYEEVLDNKKSKPDIAYQLTKLFHDREKHNQHNKHNQHTLKNTKTGDKYITINCAVEESTLADRFDGKLNKWDELVRDNIREKDILIVSVGGNDIALKPSASTLMNLLYVVMVASKENIKNKTAWGFQSLVELFGKRTEDYIKNITSKHVPHKILPCSIYYPCEVVESGGWANRALSLMGYNRDPEKLQMSIQALYEQATSQIKIEGAEVIPIALHEALDFTKSHDYVERVEPSAAGGAKMAKKYYDAIYPL